MVQTIIIINWKFRNYMIKTKQKNINFYHVQKGKKDDFSFKEELDDIYNKFRSKRYTEIEELELDCSYARFTDRFFSAL